MNYLEKYKDKILALCKTYNVQTLYSFGSVNNEKFSLNSDIDLLVTFKSLDLAKYFDNYMGLKNQLEKLLNRKVDLVESQTLRNPILIKSIENNKAPIYG